MIHRRQELLGKEPERGVPPSHPSPREPGGKAALLPLPEDMDAATEREAFQRLRQTGDPELRQALIVRYLHIVPPIIRRYRDRAEWEDLLQVGYVGLIKAVDGFRLKYSTRFVTYATHCVHGEVRHYLRDRVDLVRRPRWLEGVSRRVAAFIERHLQEKHRLPTFSEIAGAVNISEEGIIEILRSRAPVSLDRTTEGRDQGISVEKIRSLRMEHFRLPIEDRIVLMQALEKLKDLEQKIIYLFFFRDLTQSQIAAQEGLPPKTVSRTMRKALDKLRVALTREVIPGRLDPPDANRSVPSGADGRGRSSAHPARWRGEGSHPRREVRVAKAVDHGSSRIGRPRNPG